MWVSGFGVLTGFGGLCFWFCGFVIGLHDMLVVL